MSGSGMSRRVSGGAAAAAVNFGSRVSSGGLGLADTDAATAGMQAYHAPLSQTYTAAALDFDRQVRVTAGLICTSSEVELIRKLGGGGFERTCRNLTLKRCMQFTTDVVRKT